MRRILPSLGILISAGLLFGACSSSNDDDGGPAGTGGQAGGDAGGAGGVFCENVDSSGPCGLTWSSCSDGNTYAENCNPECTCSITGHVTSSVPSNANDCSDVGVTQIQKNCGWDLRVPCPTGSSTWCGAGEMCCIAGGALKCSTSCGDGGSGGTTGGTGGV